MRRPALDWAHTKRYARIMSAAPTFKPNPPVVAAAAGGSGDGGNRNGGRIMTPELHQAIRLLQLSRLELIAEIRAELEASSNPESLESRP